MNFKSFGDYDVYTDGRVWSNKSNKFLKQSINQSYIYVKLMINGRSFNVCVHRLMGEVFLPNFENLPEIDHKDRNKLNNSLFNLKWSSKSDNRHNKGIMSTNTSGYKGVHYDKISRKWIGRMTINNKRKQKQFDTKKKAILYRRELEVLSGLPYF